GLPAPVRGPRPADRGRRSSAARPLAPLTYAAARRGDDRGVRAVLDPGDRGRVRLVRRRPVELVHPTLAPPLLLLRRGRVPDALVRPRPGAAHDRAGDAVPRRPPMAKPRRRTLRESAGVGPPRRLAGARRRRARRRSPGGDGGGDPGRHARPEGTRCVEPEAAPAAPPA